MPEQYRGDLDRGAETISENDIDRYIAEHARKSGWDGVHEARRFGLKNALPYFENECDALKKSPDLKEARTLTAFIDRVSQTSAKFNKTPEELVFDLEKYRDYDYRLLSQENAAHEMQEEDTAEGNREAWNDDIRSFAEHGNVENVLRRTEAKTAFYNELINNDTKRLYRQNEKERAETKERIEANTKKRDAFRQTRANLLRLYLEHGSVH